jgi:hypothetical protein
MGRKTFRTNKKGIGEFLDQLLTKKMDLQEVGWGGMDWVDMAQDRDRWRALVSAVMNHWVP